MRENEVGERELNEMKSRGETIDSSSTKICKTHCNTLQHTATQNGEGERELRQRIE